MGLFFKRKKRTRRQPSKRAQVVRVWYCDPGEPPPSVVKERAGGYAYAWRLPGTPVLGQLVHVTGVMEGVPSYVVGFGRGSWKGALESVTRTIEGKELQRVRKGKWREPKGFSRGGT